MRAGSYPKVTFLVEVYDAVTDRLVDELEVSSETIATHFAVQEEAAGRSCDLTRREEYSPSRVEYHPLPIPEVI